MSQNVREGDWKCDCCSGPLNFSRRSACFTCGADRSSTVDNVEIIDSVETSPKRAKTSADNDDDIVIPEEYVLAVDVEMDGPQMDRSLLAIGSTFGKKNGEILHRRAFCRVPVIEDFDPETWEQFWHQFPDVLERIKKEAIDNHVAEFRVWVLSLEKIYGPFGRKHNDKVKFKLLSDNPSYDYLRVANGFRDLNPKNKPMAEMFSDYVKTEDPTEQMKGMTLAQQAEVMKQVKTTTTHWPVDDATKVFEMWCAIKRVLRN